MPNEEKTLYEACENLVTGSKVDDYVSRAMEERQQFIDALQQLYDNGEDISQYVWPDQWNIRPRPKPHLSNHIVSLADAIYLCGQSFFKDEWTEYDWYARDPAQVDEWNPANHIYMAYDFARKTKFADYSNKPDIEKIAYSRKRQIYGQLSEWLSQNKIESFTLESDGNKEVIPQNTWLADDAIKTFDEGKVYEKENGSKKFGCDGAFVYLNKLQLETCLVTIIAQNTAQNVSEPFKPKGITCPEGVWIVEASMMLSRKLFGDEAGKQKVGNCIARLVEVLVTNPEIEVFTISSYGGKKEPISRDYLRGRQPSKDFLRGLIPYSDGFHTDKENGRFIFVNKEHYENYLNDEPILPAVESSKKDTCIIKIDEQTPLAERERSSYLAIIAALLGLLLGKSSSGVPHSRFESQQAIIDCIHATYGSKAGLSKRNLEDKFAKAKEKMPSDPSS